MIALALVGWVYLRGRGRGEVKAPAPLGPGGKDSAGRQKKTANERCHGTERGKKPCGQSRDGEDGENLIVFSRHPQQTAASASVVSRARNVLCSLWRVRRSTSSVQVIRRLLGGRVRWEYLPRSRRGPRGGQSAHTRPREAPQLHTAARTPRFPPRAAVVSSLPCSCAPGAAELSTGGGGRPQTDVLERRAPSQLGLFGRPMHAQAP
ncbi:hypothetical protein BC826DRAFT_418880 [Russula brevipes]|nr:hypothetical protein BC826DRAFT_418880 [Russula brevipes]